MRPGDGLTPGPVAHWKSDTLDYIASAGRPIGRFEQVAVEARRAFSAHVPFRQRSP